MAERRSSNPLYDPAPSLGTAHLVMTPFLEEGEKLESARKLAGLSVEIVAKELGGVFKMGRLRHLELGILHASEEEMVILTAVYRKRGIHLS